MRSSLVSSLNVMDQVNHFLSDTKSDADDVHFLRNLCEKFDIQAAQAAVLAMEESIDFEAEPLIGSNTVIIKAGYDEILDNHRRIFDNLETLLVEAAHKILDLVPLLDSLSVEYVPQVGYLGLLADTMVKSQSYV